MGLLILLSGGLFFACTGEDDLRGTGSGNYPVVFAIKGDLASRASVSGTAGKTAALDYEKKLSNLTAIAFEGGAFYKTFDVNLSEAPTYGFDMGKAGSFDVYLVANAESGFRSTLRSFTGNADALGKLVATQGSDVADMFLMTSDPFSITTVAQQAVTHPTPVALTRLSARIDVYNRVEGFSITKLTFKNRAAKSHLFLQNEMPAAALGNKSYIVPATESKAYVGKIYGYENSTPGNTVLTLEGTVNGAEIRPHDIVLEEIPVKRNYLYTIIISGEAGSVTPGEPGKLSFNIVVQDWNQAAEFTIPDDQLKDTSVPDFRVLPGQGHTPSPGMENAERIAVNTGDEYRVKLEVSTVSAAARLGAKEGSLPAWLSINEGAIRYEEGRMIQDFELVFAANVSAARSVVLALVNSFDDTKRREFTVEQKVSFPIPFPGAHPFPRLAEYDVSKTRKVFAASHDPSQIGNYYWYEAIRGDVCPDGYRLPEPDEFGSDEYDILEASPSPGVSCQRILYKIIGEGERRTAYRYEFKGEFYGDYPEDWGDAFLELTGRYLGTAFPEVTLATISNEAWWNGNQEHDVTRVFPSGYKSDSRRETAFFETPLGYVLGYMIGGVRYLNLPEESLWVKGSTTSGSETTYTRCIRNAPGENITYTVDYTPFSVSPMRLDFPVEGGEQIITVTGTKTLKKYINGVHQTGEDRIAYTFRASLYHPDLAQITVELGRIKVRLQPNTGRPRRTSISIFSDKYSGQETAPKIEVEVHQAGVGVSSENLPNIPKENW